jgi:hypothetical protein
VWWVFEPCHADGGTAAPWHGGHQPRSQARGVGNSRDRTQMMSESEPSPWRRAFRCSSDVYRWRRLTCAATSAAWMVASVLHGDPFRHARFRRAIQAVGGLGSLS